MGRKDYFDNEDEVTSRISEVGTTAKKVSESVETLFDGMDSRVLDGYTFFQELKLQKQDIEEQVPDTEEIEGNYHDAYRGYRRARDYTQGINPNYGDTSGGTDNRKDNKDTKKEEYKFDRDDWNNKQPSEQAAIIQRLKDLGLSDTEINNIITGVVTVDANTLAQMRDELSDAIKHNPAVVLKLEQLLGFTIRDKDGNIDENALSFAMNVAKKNLGMDIDMNPGTAFRTQIDKMATDLESIYKSDPSVRNKIISTYGIDIFDTAGRVDKEKLAIVRVMDGINMKDGMDIDAFIQRLMGVKNGEEPGNIPTNPPGGGNDIVDPSGDDTNDPNNNPIGDKPAIVERDKETITPGLGGPSSRAEKAAESMKTSVKDGLGKSAGGILDAIEKGASRIARGISPYSAKFGSTGGLNKTTAGVIAAASVAAGGAAAGGGVLAGMKMNYIHFTPADWESLGKDYQTIIEKLMRKVGFSTDEIETFKNSKYKILASELRAHSKKIEKAANANPQFDDELVQLYDYLMLDDNLKVIDYLLFITMVIDGRNTVDEYNMYNVINLSLEDDNEDDYLYNGIIVEDYIDDSEDEEIHIVNDPTVPKEETKVEEKDELTENFSEEDRPGMDKEWLKDIGIDD